MMPNQAESRTPQSQTLRIGELAARTGVETATLRYYETCGVVDPPDRSRSGYRHYPVEAVRRVHFIRRARALGFSLEEIRDLLSLRTDKVRGAGRVRDLATEKLLQVRERIRDLRAIERTLAELTTGCDGNGPGDSCSILGSLAGEDS